MKIQDKYIETLKKINDFVTVREWAIQFCKDYPDEFSKAEKQAKNQKTESTGLREIAARISSALSKNRFGDYVIEDRSESPRKAKYVTVGESKKVLKKLHDEDTEIIRRDEIIRNAKDKLKSKQLYRITELENIIKTFNLYFGTSFHLEHANAIKDVNNAGEHHPDNLQILLKSHNSKKSNTSWKRFDIDQQIDYINKAISLQRTVMDKFGYDYEQYILDSLINRLKNIY